MERPDREGPDSPAAAAPAAALSTGAVARRLGVSPTTLRSWERRYAIGPARREDGRHRRWTPQDIARLEAMCALTAQGVPPAEAARVALAGPPAGRGRGPGAESGESVAPPLPASRPPGGRHALPLGEVRQECRGLARAAVRLDATAVQDLLDEAVDTHGLVTAWEEVIVPTLHAVGRKWASAGERYVEVEHLLSWHVSGTLHRARPAPARPSGPAGGSAPPVVLACTPGEQHSLPMEALTAALVERGLPVRMFGAALPSAALHDAVRRTGPRAVVLWAQSRTTADRALARAVAGIEWGPAGARSRPVLLPAGPGWGPGGTTAAYGPRLHGLRSGLAVIEELMRRAPPEPGRRGAPAGRGASGS
ncbi:MerR family transcriptional regulator [Streptomyces sp. NPDC002073]|uniref:MerR family transcriptional regulator n=1 Tax=Streptomyces sp. NBC_00239 TaxID=2903640 RepID=UPI002E2DD840|nr:MerR family transcriptional regulator [Streptomyces sp. NBC_00239]